jgi:hypothetical protein
MSNLTTLKIKSPYGALGIETLSCRTACAMGALAWPACGIAKRRKA